MHRNKLQQPKVTMASIIADDEMFAQFKEDSRKQYRRIWAQFLIYNKLCDWGGGRYAVKTSKKEYGYAHS